MGYAFFASVVARLRADVGRAGPLSRAQRPSRRRAEEVIVPAEERVRELGIQIPMVARPAAGFDPAVRTGDLVFVSGNTPTVDGKLTGTGMVGDAISVEEAQDAARLATLNCLAAVRGLVGSLDAVERVVRVTGYVASTPDFTDQPKVINGASLVLQEIFGEAGRHARSAIGVAALPGGASVEVELIVQLRESTP